VILFISVSNERRKEVMKKALTYSFASALTAVFGLIYELFSHGVYSYYMIYAFLFLLVGGTCVQLHLAFNSRRLPCRLASDLFESGIITLTVGSLFSSVLEIYGTTNALTAVYWAVGAALTAAGILIYCTPLNQK
jgi:hypothetical protein